MKIAVGYDGTDEAKEAVKMAIVQAKAFNGSIDIIYSIIERTAEDSEYIKNSKIELENLKQQVKDAGIDCETHLLVRDLMPGEDLVSFSKENNIDEIIIGVRKRSQLGKVIFGSYPQYVIMNANCPVLCVKTK